MKEISYLVQGLFPATINMIIKFPPLLLTAYAPLLTDNREDQYGKGLTGYPGDIRQEDYQNDIRILKSFGA